MDVTVYQQDGSESGRTVSLEPTVFDVEPNDHVIWLDVRRLQASKRQGTHKAKQRNEVRGSGRKLYRQKGTGFARAGDAKSPIRKTGGRAHAPSPRDYGLNLNKKTKRLARRSALTYKAREDALRVVEDFSLDAPSTRTLTDLADALEAAGRKMLLLTAENEPMLYQSSRNLSRFEVQEARNATTYDLLNAQVILVQEGGLEALVDILGKQDAVAA